MDQPLLLLILLGLIAAFMPWQFGYEVYLFGQDRGLQKAAFFVAGITAFRCLLLFVVGLIFTGLSTGLTQTVFGLARIMQDLLVFLGREIVSGQRALLDLLLVISGFVLLFESFLYYGQSTAEESPEKVAEDKGRDKSMWSLFLFGFGWTAVSTKQWLLTLTASSAIILIAPVLPGQVLLSLLFLLLASVMLLPPFLIYALWPERAAEILEQINTWINTSLVYVIVFSMIAGGVLLIWLGARGLLNFAV